MTEDKQYQDIGYLIGRRLQARALDGEPALSDDHLDADTVAAFVEGRIEESGASLITSHLILCSACRRATAKTMHLEDAVAAEDDQPAAESSPGRLRQFLDDLASQVFPSSEEVVFAYQDQSVRPDSAEDDGIDEGSTESDNNAEK